MIKVEDGVRDNIKYFWIYDNNRNNNLDISNCFLYKNRITKDSTRLLISEIYS